MPNIASEFRPFPLLKGPDLQTIVPNRLRYVLKVRYTRDQIAGDGWPVPLYRSGVGGGRCVVLAHGLGGHVNRVYVRGMVRAFNRAGWDAVAWPVWGQSSAGSEPPHFYHSGTTSELRWIVERLGQEYDTLGLVGLSLGGNVMLKYLGEQGEALDPTVVAAVGVSVPIDLRSSSYRLGDRRNRLYQNRFLNELKASVRLKAPVMPEISTEGLDEIESLTTFDDRYTAPLNGFAGADDYYARFSSRPYLSSITIPTLILNARNDSFLAPPCYPFAEAGVLERIYLETPNEGGHVGFMDRWGRIWSERRAVRFVSAAIEA